MVIPAKPLLVRSSRGVDEFVGCCVSVLAHRDDSGLCSDHFGRSLCAKRCKMLMRSFARGDLGSEMFAFRWRLFLRGFLNNNPLKTLNTI